MINVNQKNIDCFCLILLRTIKKEVKLKLKDNVFDKNEIVFQQSIRIHFSSLFFFNSVTLLCCFSHFFASFFFFNLKKVFFYLFFYLFFLFCLNLFEDLCSFVIRFVQLFWQIQLHCFLYNIFKDNNSIFPSNIVSLISSSSF